MKVFTFRYEKNPIASAMQKMDRAVKTGTPEVHPDEMVCASYELMNKVMSPSRLDIFVAIVENRPESLYELAQILSKDQSQVLKDTKTLESLGLVKLVPNKDGGRERSKPEPLYEKIVFEVTPKRIAKSA